MISIFPMQMKLYDLYSDDEENDTSRRKKRKKPAPPPPPTPQESALENQRGEKEDTAQFTNMILTDQQKCLQFLCKHKVEDGYMAIPEYMKPLLPPVFPAGTIRYEGDLEERIARYEKQVSLLSSSRDPAPKKAHLRKELRVSRQRKIHYLQCKFLWVCQFVVGSEVWRDVVGPVHVGLCLCPRKSQQHIDWSNMEEMLFGLDTSKSETEAVEEDDTKDPKISRWRRSMAVSDALCKRMKERLAQML